LPHYVLVLLLYLGLLVSFFAFTFFVPLQVTVQARKKEKDELFLVRVNTLGGLLDYSYQVSAVWREDLEAAWQAKEVLWQEGEPRDREIEKIAPGELNWRRIIKGFRLGKRLGHEYAHIVRYLARKTWVESFSWETTVGTGDAAATALTYGTFWALKGSLFALLSQQARLRRGVVPRIKVQPDFLRARFATDFRCIFVTRLGHIMTAANILFWRLLLKGVLLGERTSNPGPDEDGHGKH